jgi:hypothetical protein
MPVIWPGPWRRPNTRLPRSSSDGCPRPDGQLSSPNF